MSILNKQLIDQLLKISQVSTFPTEAKSIAAKLIKNLKQEALKPNSQFTADKGDLSIQDPKLLRNLNNLLPYLQNNLVRYNGYSIVVPTNQGKLDPVYQKYNIYYPYPKDQPKFYVYKDGLISFIRELQKQAINSKNAIAESMINNLITEVNSDFSSMNKEIPEETTRLDMLPNPMSTDKPFELGNLELTSQHLSSQSEFSNFFKNIPIVEQSKSLTMSENPKEYVKKVLKYLNKRADGFSVHGRPQDKAYVIAIKKLNAMYPDLSDQPEQKTLTSQQNSSLGNLVWPFFQDKIDIDQLSKFFNWYVNFTSQGNASDKSTSEAYKNYQTNINSFMQTYPGMRTQLLGSEGISQIRNNIYAKTSGRENSPLKYIQTLQSLIGGAYGALGHLETIFQGLNSPNFQDYLQYIDQQKAAYQRNLIHLERLEQASEDEFRNLQRQNR